MLSSGTWNLLTYNKPLDASGGRDHIMIGLAILIEFAAPRQFRPLYHFVV